MKVILELHSGEERTYHDVSNVSEKEKYQITIHGENGILAVLNKGDIKKLLTESEPE